MSLTQMLVSPEKVIKIKDKEIFIFCYNVHVSYCSCRLTSLSVDLSDKL